MAFKSRLLTGSTGVIPFKDLPEVRGGSNLKSLELPNPYIELVVTDSKGARHEIPWELRSPLL